MISYKPSFAVAALAVAMVGAQQNYTVDPNSVPIATRKSWCQSQIASCPLLCLQNTNSTDSKTIENTCSPTTLVYSCVCGNGDTPNMQNYSQTIPFFECQEYGNQCVAACGQGQSPCQAACRNDHPCGAQNPTRINTTASSSMEATATSGGSVVYTGLGGSSSSSKKSGSSRGMELGGLIGTLVVIGGLFGGMAVLL